MDLNASVESTSSNRSTSDAVFSTYAAEINLLSEVEQSMFKRRLKSRKRTETDEIIDLACNLCDLHNVAFKKFGELIDNVNTTSIHCFKVILNSLHGYYSSQSHDCTMSQTCSSCKESVATFLRGYLTDFASSFVPSASTKNGKAELAFRQRELISLLSLHLFRRFPQTMEKLDVVCGFLNFIYFHSGSERLKNFLDTTVCDEFFLDLPFCVAALYDELGMICPQDFERFRPAETDENLYDEGLIDSNGLAARLEEFINEVRIEDVEVKKKVEKPVQKNKKITSKVTLRAPDKVFEESPVKTRPTTHLPNCDGLLLVKQTPIEKLRRLSLNRSNGQMFSIGDEFDVLMSRQTTAERSMSRKRVHSTTGLQTSIPAKKPKVEPAKSRLNLSTLFANF